MVTGRAGHVGEGTNPTRGCDEAAAREPTDLLAYSPGIEPTVVECGDRDVDGHRPHGGALIVQREREQEVGVAAAAEHLRVEEALEERGIAVGHVADAVGGADRGRAETRPARRQARDERSHPRDARGVRREASPTCRAERDRRRPRRRGDDARALRRAARGTCTHAWWCGWRSSTRRHASRHARTARPTARTTGRLASSAGSIRRASADGLGREGAGAAPPSALRDRAASLAARSRSASTAGSITPLSMCRRRDRDERLSAATRVGRRLDARRTAGRRARACPVRRWRSVAVSSGVTHAITSRASSCCVGLAVRHTVAARRAEGERATLTGDGVMPRRRDRGDDRLELVGSAGRLERSSRCARAGRRGRTTGRSSIGSRRRRSGRARADGVGRGSEATIAVAEPRREIRSHRRMTSRCKWRAPTRPTTSGGVREP